MTDPEALPVVRGQNIFYVIAIIVVIVIILKVLGEF